MNLRTLFCLLILPFGILAQSFEEKEISLNRENGKVRGTHCIPKESNGKVVLMISGSGPTDRNGNSTMGLKTDMLKLLAHDLAKNETASVRYDKRLIGESTFEGYTEADMLFDDLVDDAIEWVKQLKEKYKHVYILGHSEGAMIALMANYRENSNGVIHLTGPAKSGDNIIYGQLYKQMPPLADTARVIMDKIKAGDFDQNINPMLAPLFRQSVMPYLQSWFKQSPSKWIGLTREPVLVIYGTEDLQIENEDAVLLKTVQAKAEVVKLEGMNHVLRKIEAGNLQANYESYNKPELALHEELLPNILKFINQ